MSPTAPAVLSAKTDEDLLSRYRSVRDHTAALCRSLSDADATIQSMPDASPAKWHLAHTTWFFEEFVLDGEPFHPRYAYLFNSYYNAVGERHARPQRGLLSRPSLDEIRAWREHVDTRIAREWERLDHDRIELGLHHEQQHQELLLTDILHAFAQNPLRPAPCPDGPQAPAGGTDAQGWQDYLGGKCEIGHDGEGFAFDCEGPRHTQWIAPFSLRESLVTQGEFAEFIADGGYNTSALWLSDGWDWVQSETISAPLHWGEEVMTLQGPQQRGPDAPVRHVSFFEADAYARWADARLPTEFEWEHASLAAPVPGMFGQLWQWTVSAYLPYPGFRPAPGAIGEYNGKFMNGCRVLKGGSFATPPGHIRATYRNFFAPTARWQFTGIRLAR